jgi:hypothetical protein
MDIYLHKLMKLSWTSIKISIAGAKLSHLVQKDRIWDHGSMGEQARIIFYLVHKAKASGNIESLKKQCSASCFEKIKIEIADEERKGSKIMMPMIKEIAIVDVQPGKNNKPDMFCSLIKYFLKETYNGIEAEDRGKDFIAKWCFIRQGEWWVLNDIK